MDEDATPTASIPFHVEVRVPAHAPGYEVELQVTGATAGMELDDTAEILSYYFGAVNGGAFCLETAAPSKSSFEITAHGVKGDGSLLFRGIARNVAPGAWRILLSILAQTHYKLDPLGEVRLIEVGGTGEQLTRLTDLLGCAYPRSVGEIPFPVEIDEALPGQSDFTVRIEFGVAVEDELLELVEESLLDWDSIVYLGGYHGDYAELEEPQLEPSDTYRGSPTSIEHRIRAWSAPLIALESLINIVSKLHDTYPVVRLEIE